MFSIRGASVIVQRHVKDRRTVRVHDGIRRYAEGHARRLRFIKEAQKLGFSLDEVGELLSLDDGLHCREVEQIASHKLATVRERMAQLGKIETVLAVLVGKCHGNRGKLRCPAISSLERPTG